MMPLTGTASKVKIFDSIDFELFSGLRLSKFWQIVCGEPSDTVVDILVLAVSSVALPLRTMILNIFRVSAPVGIVIPKATSVIAISIMMLAARTGIMNNNVLGICSIDGPMMYLSKSGFRILWQI